MKINEFNDLQIDEFNPFSKSDRTMRRANKAGKKDLEATIDKLIGQYAAHLGTQGKNPKKSTFGDLKDFLDSKNVDTSSITGDMNQIIPTKQIKSILSDKAKQAMIGKGAKPAPVAPTQPAQQPQTQQKPTSAYVKTKDAALKLSSKEKRRLIAQLQKSVDSTARQKPEFTSSRAKPQFKSTRT